MKPNDYIEAQKRVEEAIKDLENHEKLFVLDIIVHKIRRENKQNVV